MSQQGLSRQERVAALETQIADAIQDLEDRMAQGQSQAFIEALEWWSQFHRYSFNNVLLIMLQRPEAIQVAGFRTWERLGFHVKRGERAIYVRGPIFKKELDPQTGDIVEHLIGYMPMPVFDISQTAEWPEKQPPEPILPATGAEWESLYRHWVELLTTKHGYTVKEGPTGTAYGMARETTILINEHLGVAHKAPVLLHEVAHIVAGHTLKKEEKGQDTMEWTLQDRECQVEAAAFVLCRMLGADHPAAVDYLLNYRIDAGKLRSHLEVIGKIVRQIRSMLQFERLPFEEITPAAA